MNTTPRIHGVEHIGIMVNDIQAAVDWYTGNLGFDILDRWENAESGMSWAHLMSAGFRIEFVQRRALTTSEGAQSGIHHVALVVEDCDQWTTRLVAAGGTTVFAPSYFERHDMDWSFVRDPFGTILELIAYRHTPDSMANPPVPNQSSQG